RSGDYLQMYVRLTLIGGLLIYFIPNDLLKIAFAVLFIYMSNFQVISLYHHHRVIVWLDLYTLESKFRVDAFLSLTLRLTIVQTLIFSFLFLIQLNVLYTVLTLVIGSLFNILFNYKYVKNRLVKDI